MRITAGSPYRLPDELILQICKEADATPLQLGAWGRVDRQWHRVCQSNELWRPWCVARPAAPMSLSDAFMARTGLRTPWGNSILAAAYTDSSPLGFDIDDHHLGSNLAHPFLLRDQGGRDDDVDAAIIAHKPTHMRFASAVVRNNLPILKRTLAVWPEAALYAGAGLFKKDAVFTRHCLKQLRHEPAVRFFSSLPKRFRYREDFAETALQVNLANLQHIRPDLQTDVVFLTGVLRHAPVLYNPPARLLHQLALMPVLAERGYWHLLPDPQRLSPQVLNSALPMLYTWQDVQNFAATLIDREDLDRAQNLYNHLNTPEREHLLMALHAQAGPFFFCQSLLCKRRLPGLPKLRPIVQFAGILK